MPKHTPGPWEVKSTDTLFSIIGAKGVRVLQTSWHSSIRNPYPLKAEALANATLAAAAPDLLEALRDAHATLVEHFAHEAPAVIERAQAAMAKAGAA